LLTTSYSTTALLKNMATLKLALPRFSARLHGLPRFNAQPSSRLVHHLYNPTVRELEVRRKFTPTEASIMRLHRNNGVPPFTSRIYRKFFWFDPKFADLDTRCGTLGKNGIHVCLSDLDYDEVSVRQGGGPHRYINSYFTGSHDIDEFLASGLPGNEFRIKDLGVEVFTEAHRH
jgi:hypothetical protein